MSDEITVDQAKLLIAYAFGQRTAYGMTTEEDIVAYIRAHTASNGLKANVTEDTVKEVLSDLLTLRAVVNTSTQLPYG